MQPAQPRTPEHPVMPEHSVMCCILIYRLQQRYRLCVHQSAGRQWLSVCAERERGHRSAVWLRFGCLWTLRGDVHEHNHNHTHTHTHVYKIGILGVFIILNYIQMAKEKKRYKASQQIIKLFDCKY